MIAICVYLTRPKPKVSVKVDWRNIKHLVRALLNPRDYAPSICLDIGVREMGEAPGTEF